MCAEGYVLSTKYFFLDVFGTKLCTILVSSVSYALRDRTRNKKYRRCFFGILRRKGGNLQIQGLFLLKLGKLFVYPDYFYAILWNDVSRLRDALSDTLKLGTIHGSVCCLFVAVKTEFHILRRRFRLFQSSRFSSTMRRIKSDTVIPSRSASWRNHLICGRVKTTDCFELFMRYCVAPNKHLVKRFLYAS